MQRVLYQNYLNSIIPNHIIPDHIISSKGVTRVTRLRNYRSPPRPVPLGPAPAYLYAQAGTAGLVGQDQLADEYRQQHYGSDAFLHT